MIYVYETKKSQRGFGNFMIIVRINMVAQNTVRTNGVIQAFRFV